MVAPVFLYINKNYSVHVCFMYGLLSFCYVLFCIWSEVPLTTHLQNNLSIAVRLSVIFLIAIIKFSRLNLSFQFIFYNRPNLAK